MRKMPTLFIPHGGGPCFFMDWDPPGMWDEMAKYLRGISDDIGPTPKAIVLISGHWEEDVVTVQNNPAPDMLFDYFGFPEHTYQLEYPAPGAPEVADRITSLLAENGIKSRQDSKRGFDHGVFIPLLLAYPDAKIPVVQMSLRSDLDPAHHIEIGKALEPMRDEGILFIGSGLSYHNMKTLMQNLRGGDVAAPESQIFDDWLTTAATDQDPDARNKALIGWEQAPAARDAHPREEHLLPLHVIVGLAGSDTGQKTYGDTVLSSVQSAFQFG